MMFSSQIRQSLTARRTRGSLRGQKRQDEIFLSRKPIDQHLQPQHQKSARGRRFLHGTSQRKSRLLHNHALSMLNIKMRQ